MPAGSTRRRRARRNLIEDITALTGNTPLYRLSRISEEEGNTLLAKLEWYNPTGSVKDRMVAHILGQAASSGRIKPGDTIIEPTSGNTGVSLAAFGAARGYRVILVMPDTAPVERRHMLAALGAHLELTPAEQGMRGAIERAEELVQEIPDSYMLSQFINPGNPEAHYQTTGPEIWYDTEGQVDILVAGIGTGGTITGAGRFLKKKKPECRVIGVEPAESAVIHGGEPGRHGISGIGAGFVPKTLDLKVVDQVVTVSSEEAKEGAKRIARVEGLLVGISSGAALMGALAYLSSADIKGAQVVIIFPDSGIPYLSTGLYR
ncbi:cysteine synthase A [Spirochaeta thermophila]|uniref:cysteine synthase n=1 Tax=Winmispira thermophila (strain ATCC 49972 / DSM 6192 / RI 19.B1) TaxID=665571 RepID=E0RTI0_WINT6|nr:cysteine synthase A [Spirochaeta thermophila]ADN02211.1 cysteine synthase A [Spirochaeta thermophila DSM 6192]